jgi:hypothetical protein
MLTHRSHGKIIFHFLAVALRFELGSSCTPRKRLANDIVNVFF